MGLQFSSFHSYLSSGINLQGNAVCATADGGLVTVGFTASGTAIPGRTPLIPFSGSLGDALVVKWDSIGNVVWFTYLGIGSANIQLDKIAETGDGGIVLLGYMNGPGNFPVGGLSPILPGTTGDDTDIYIVRLRSDGSLAWHTVLGGGGSGNEYDNGGLVVMDDGSIYISGTAGSGAPASMGSVNAIVPFTAGDNNNILVAKLSSSGELLWFRYIGGGGTGASYFALSLAATLDGNLVIGGDAMNSPVNMIDGSTAILPFDAGDDRASLAVKIDQAGNLLWFSYLGGGGAASPYTNIGVTSMNDGSVVLNGTATAGVNTIGGISAILPYASTNINGLLWKLDPDGQLQWFTYLGGGTGYYNLMDVRRAADGGIFTGGTAQDGSATMGSKNEISSCGASVNCTFLAKLNMDGNIEWFTYASAGAGSIYGINGLAATQEGGVVGIGSAQNGAPSIQGQLPLNPYQSGDTYDLFLMKLTPQGRL